MLSSVRAAKGFGLRASCLDFGCLGRHAAARVEYGISKVLGSPAHRRSICANCQSYAVFSAPKRL